MKPGMGMEGDGDGGDHLGPKVPKNHKKKIVHTSETFFENVKNFKISSYIQKNTTNPINAFKITNHNTKHTNNAKIYLKKL